MSMSRTAPAHIIKQPLTHGKAQEAVHIAQSAGGLHGTKALQEQENDNLVKGASATQHKDPAKTHALLDEWSKRLMDSKNNSHVKTVTKKVLIPVEEEVLVPVVRKEAQRKMENKVVLGNKVVPVTKHKTVEETVLEVQNKVINGRTEKRAVPVTKQKKIAYTEFENRPVEVTVQVPVEQVVTRKGTRKDTHVVSKLVEVSEDHVYEMRPVYVGLGETRMKQIAEHSKFKTEHGKPKWEDNVCDGWIGRPLSPTFRADLPRPESARSLRSSASTSFLGNRTRTPGGQGSNSNQNTGMLGKSASTGKLNLSAARGP